MPPSLPVIVSPVVSSERPRYINVDELMPQVSLEQAAAYYGVQLPELKRLGDEIRTRCFLNCGVAEQTGDRALAIRADHPAKQWKCHQYGCGRGGNLVSLCDLLKPGPHSDGRPRGDRFKEIAADIKAMVDGIVPEAATTTAQRRQPEPAKPAPARKNVPLSRSDNERARALTQLHEKFTNAPATMPPAAARYFRTRPFLSPEVCQKWRVGYLPRDSGGGNAGGTMRGKIVYPVLSEAGEVLTWFGRDPEHEEKHRKWIAAGREGSEPEKFRFVKGFHRGQELFGQDRSRLRETGYREAIEQLGIVVVEGPNDVIALDRFGIPAVGLLSNTITQSQAEKLARWTAQLRAPGITLLLDCDEEGENGAKQAAWLLAQRCRVRTAWSEAMHGGQFKGRQPESLTAEEWQTLCGALR